MRRSFANKESLFGGELPREVEINGKIYPFSTDFYDWMRFETLMLDKDVPDSMKTDIAVKMLFNSSISDATVEHEPPPSVPALIRFLLWFWRCGQSAAKHGHTKYNNQRVRSSGQQIYSFEYDEPLIFAAFWQQYGIDLTSENLHWWKFKALFDALTEETKFVKVMGYRAMDLSDSKLPPDRLKHYKKLKEIYKLPRPLSEQQKLDRIKQSILNSS